MQARFCFSFRAKLYKMSSPTPQKVILFIKLIFIIKYLNAKKSYEKFCMLGRGPYFLMLKSKDVFSSFLNRFKKINHSNINDSKINLEEVLLKNTISKYLKEVLDYNKSVFLQEKKNVQTLLLILALPLQNYSDFP